MLVSKKHKKLILNLNNPTRVTTVIPTAKTFEFKGKELLAVPHELDEVRVLNNMGIRAPSPISYHYKWSGQYVPFDHQRTTAEFLTINPKSYCLLDMGLGKSLSVLWTYDYLRSVGKANKMLIISPLSTLERVWADEIFMHFPHLDYTVLHGANKARRTKLLAQDTDIYIINHDGIKVIQNELIERTDIDVVVIDELASFRNASTDRFKSLATVIDKRSYVWGLTGSPIPNAPTDAWAQCKLISPDRVPKYFSRFRDITMRQMGPFKWVARPEALSVVQEAMQPAIRYKRDECLDLPPTTVTTRHVDLSSEQRKMYSEMLKQLKTEYGQGEILAVNEAVKVGKLLQICCGVAYGNDKEEVVIPATPRLEVLKEIIEEAEGKVIVFIPLSGALARVAEDLRKAHITVEVVHGGVSKNERDRIFQAFQKAHDPRVLVANPKTMSHGLTLTEASVVVWFTPVFDAEVYEQACARITRPGQKRNTLIVHIEGSDVERRCYKKLADKGALQGTLLQMIKEDMENA
jgi:SNF2 family DNA or RNA helicase